MSAARNSILQQIEDLEEERDDCATMLARVESANQEKIPSERRQASVRLRATRPSMARV